MSINAIGFNSRYYSGSCLSEETRRKLLALGIDPSTVASEAQAQVLIAQLQNSQQIQKTSNTDTQTNCSSEQELISRAKTLAKKLCIIIPQGMTLDEILQSISAKINKLALQAGQDEERISQIQKFQNELDEISSKYTVLKQNENAMFASMNFNANVNRMMLGL